MKNYYKISEISRLYGVGVDSLRYYERLGILQPKRDANGYRLYSLKDIYKLNLIRDLRQLDFSMAQIKAYLDGQSVDNTLELLEREQALLRERIRALRQREAILRRRSAALRDMAAAEPGAIQLRSFPERPCVQLSEYITRDEEMDFVIKRLHQRHEDRLRDFGDLSIGAFFSTEDLALGLTNRYRAVFFLLERGTKGFDFVLPAGEYLSCVYRGEYEQNGQRVQQAMAWADSQGLRLLGDPFELYLVDNRYTVRPEEFLTEIQIQVAPENVPS